VTPADYAAAKAALVTVSFLGRSVRCVPRFARKLAKVEAALRAEWQRAQLALVGGAPTQTFAEWHGVKSIGGHRDSAGYHGLGRAVDLDVPANGYAVTRTETARGVVLGGERAGAKLPGVRAAFLAACDRACDAAGVPCDLSIRRKGEATGAVWDRWHDVSEAVRAYVSPYYETDDALDNGAADVRPGVAIPDQVRADYEALRVPLVVGGPRLHPESMRNPARGIMSLRRPVVVALCDVGGMRWGACDFGASESGDLMHFDDAS
jgi:hypothetical protein